MPDELLAIGEDDLIRRAMVGEPGAQELLDELRRLRNELNWAKVNQGGLRQDGMEMAEAADALQAENKRLRKALAVFAYNDYWTHGFDAQKHAVWIWDGESNPMQEAMQALRGGEKPVYELAGDCSKQGGCFCKAEAIEWVDG